MNEFPYTLPFNLGGETAGFAATGTLSAVAYSPQRSAALSGTGTLTAAAYSPQRAATLSGTGVLSTVVRERYTRTAAPSMTGSLSANVDGSRRHQFPYTLPFSLGSEEAESRSINLSATGTLSAVAYSPQRSAYLSATGHLETLVVLRYARSITLSGVGTLSAAANAGLGEGAILSAAGTLSATARKTRDAASATLSGSGVLSATTMFGYSRTAEISATGTLSASCSGGLGVRALPSMTGTLSAIATYHPPPPDTRPVWATSVNAFAAASRQSVSINTATQLQYPSTNQLTGVCSNLFSGSAFTNGLLNYGDPNTQGVAGAMVSGTQSTADSLCGLMGGVGADTTPQALVGAATDVQGAIDSSPMASGTIEMGQGGTPSGNTALDAIHGMQNLADSLYSILQGCGCGQQNDPAGVSPQQVIDTSQETADGITNSPFASGIITMGQDPGSGNVALDAINGAQTFANGLFQLLTICGCGNQQGAGLRGGQLFRAGDNPYSPDNVDPQTILDVAQAIADAVTANPFAQDFTGAQSGNIAVDALLYGQDLVDSTHSAIASALSTDKTLVDVVNAGGQAINQNTAQHVSHTSLNTAQSLVSNQENLLVAQNFSRQYVVVDDPDGHWVWDGADGAVTLGCLKVTANGTQLDYVSNEIPVVAGETLELSCNVKCGSLSYTGTNPIRFGVEKYRIGKTATGDRVYTDVGGNNITSSTLTSPAATTGWLDVAGIYVVEPGVDQVRFRFQVGANAISGTVKFDEANLLKTDLIADECVPGVGTTVDSIVTQLYGASGNGFTHNDAAVALANTANALVAVTSKVAALEAEGHSGAIAGDDFSWTGEITTSPNWGGAYDGGMFGSYGADGSNAVWTSDFSPRTARFKWEGTDQYSSTNYQLIQTVLSTAPTYPSPYEIHAYLHLLGRIADDWSSYCRASIGSDGTYSVGYVNSGVYTAMDSGIVDPIPGSGKVVSFYCGNAVTAAPRHFTLKVGEQIVADFDEAGTSSPLGASNLGWGWGSYVDAQLIFLLFTFAPASGTPPEINQWLAMDQ